MTDLSESMHKFLIDVVDTFVDECIPGTKKIAVCNLYIFQSMLKFCLLCQYTEVFPPLNDASIINKLNQQLSKALTSLDVTSPKVDIGTQLALSPEYNGEDIAIIEEGKHDVAFPFENLNHLINQFVPFLDIEKDNDGTNDDCWLLGEYVNNTKWYDTPKKGPVPFLFVQLLTARQHTRKTTFRWMDSKPVFTQNTAFVHTFEVDPYLWEVDGCWVTLINYIEELRSHLSNNNPEKGKWLKRQYMYLLRQKKEKDNYLILPASQVYSQPLSATSSITIESKLQPYKDEITQCSPITNASSAWQTVQQKLGDEVDDNTYTTCMDALQCVEYDKTVVSDNINNTLRLKLIRLGLDVYLTKRQTLITNGQLQHAHVHNAYPTLRLLSTIMYYFNFNETQRQEYMHNFAKLLITSMFRSRVILMNYDQVDYNGKTYVVIDDGLSKGATWQKQVTIQLENDTMATKTIDVNELKLLINSQGIQNSKSFVLPGCKFQEVTYLQQDDQLTPTERYKLALDHMEVVKTITNVLIVSITMAIQHFELPSTLQGGIFGYLYQKWENVRQWAIDYLENNQPQPITHAQKLLEKAKPSTNALTNVFDRSRLPKLPDWGVAIYAVNEFDRVRLNLDATSPLLFQSLAGAGIEGVRTTSMGGATSEMMTTVQEWIEGKESSRAGPQNTTFTRLWKVPGGLNTNPSRMNTILEIVRNVTHLNVESNIPNIYQHMTNINDIFRKELTKESNVAQTQKVAVEDLDTFDALFKQLLTKTIDQAPSLTDAQRGAIKSNLTMFVNRAFQYMIAHIEPRDSAHRIQYIINFLNVFIFYLGFTNQTYSQAYGMQAFTFPVQNYDANDFLDITTLDRRYDRLQRKLQNVQDGMLTHEQFAEAVRRMQNLDIIDRDTRPITSYSYVTQFLNAMDRILAKFGSVIGDNTRVSYFATEIKDNKVLIRLIPDKDRKSYQDSFDSIDQFFKQDTIRVVEGMLENDKVQMAKEHVNSWEKYLKENVNTPHSPAPLSPKVYRPCIKLYNGQVYYACAWNFPLRILPALNDKVNLKQDFLQCKIGCFNCNMYAITNEYSFGLTPGAYYNALRRKKDAEKDDNTQTIHRRTNYAMMFMDPMKYHFDFLPLMTHSAKQVGKSVKFKSEGKWYDGKIKHINDDDTFDIDNTENNKIYRSIPSRDVRVQNKSSTSDQSTTNKNDYLNSLKNKNVLKALGKNNKKFNLFRSVKNVFTNKFKNKYTNSLVKDVICTILAGCYYVPKASVRIEGGEVDALELMDGRRESGPTSFDMYPVLDLAKFGIALSPIVYSIFYYFNGIMQINGKLSPFILPYYESYSQTEGRGEFNYAYFQNKNKAANFTIDNKMKALQLEFPSSPSQTSQQAQTNAAQQSSSSNNQNSSSGFNVTDAFKYILMNAGLWLVFKELTDCKDNTSLPDDRREKCAHARKAIIDGAKNKFKSGGYGHLHDWEQAMSNYPKYFAKKSDGTWTDAEEVDDSKKRYDRNGNKLSRGDENYYDSNGMSIRNGRRSNKNQNGFSEGAQKRIQQLEAQNQRLQKKSDQKNMMDSRKINREYGKKFQEGAGANIEITDAQGDLVFKLLPHNIVANILMVAYAGLTLWAASSGTSTYTRLLDVEYTKYSSKLADLQNLQPSRMACSFFFGMGIGIFVAFIASMVELANHKRVRQILFILLMAVPIIVLGAIGINGSKNVCDFNTGGQCPINDCVGSGICEFQKDGATQTCKTTDDCPIDTCNNNTCELSGQTCKSDVQPSLQFAQGPVGKKRKRFLPESKSKFPRLSNFWKSLTGTHESDRTRELFGGDDDSSSDHVDADDVLRYNVMGSDYMFIGLGCGVLIAGLFTLLPDNPFHPSKFDVAYQSNAQKDFTTVSQVNPKWWIYGLVFTLIMGGAGTSSLILSHTPVTNFNDNQTNPPRDVRKDGQIQSIIAVIASVVMFAIVFGLGWWHLKRHRKKGELMAKYGSSNTNSAGVSANQLSNRNK